MRFFKRLSPIFICICLIVPYTKAYAAKDTLKLKTGKCYHGFKLTEQKQLEELKSTALIFQHVKSGARLLYLKNEDDNKVFSINFATIPTDDTGVNHILEHSVLCGSEKYPVKSPFKSMMDRSLKTFLNALTYADCTMYPVASRNDKDFRNLMSVYLDAVFYPKLTKDPRIFLQEGWRHELKSKDDDIIYNGIVYNEMKGAYTSPEAVLYETQIKTLFPHSPYQYVSGGKPDAILTLTRDKYLETYERNYHPSNSYIYLYGDLDINETLKFINEDYLSKFEKKEIHSVINKQKPFSERIKVTSAYPLAADSPVDNRTYLSLSYVLDTEIYTDSPLAVSALSAILIGSQSSPLKNALLTSGIGEEVFGYVTTDLQPTLNIIVKNCNGDKAEEFARIVDETLSCLVENGIDKQLIDGLLTTTEISLRSLNSSANRGIQYNKSIMSGWLYFNDPIKFIQPEKEITNLKKGLNSNYFEKAIKKYLIDNNHSALVVLEPKPSLIEEKAAIAKEKLTAVKKELTEVQLLNLREQNQSLKEWQGSPDTPEAMATLPTLSLSDIDSKVSVIPTKKVELDGIKVLGHPVFTNKLVYINMYFDASGIPHDKVPYLYLLSNIIGKLGTEKYSSGALSHELLKSTGGFSSNIMVPHDSKNKSHFSPKLLVSTYTVAEKLPIAFKLINEIMTKSNFEDTKEFKILLNEVKSSLTSKIINNNIGFAIERNMSYYMPSARYQSNASIQLYHLLSDIDKNYESKKDIIINNLKETAELVFNKNKLVIGVTAEEKDHSKFLDNLKLLTNGLENAELPTYRHQYAASNQNEAFVIPSSVQTVVKGANYIDLGYSYSGSMSVLNNLINNYLFQAIRVQGGAYGGHFYTDSNGTALFLSYSDPNLKETLSAYDNTETYLKQLGSIKAMDDSMLNNLIINTIGQIDYPLDPHQKGTSADICYLTNVSVEDLQKTRSEILSTKADDLSLYIEMISSVIKNGTYTVVGSQSKIEENKELFTNIINPLNSQIPAYFHEDRSNNNH